MTHPPVSPLRAGLAALAFCLVATLNSGGYRYGVGDQAFHLPAIERHLVSESFPRDRELLDAQDGLTLVNRATARVVSTTGISVAPLLFGAYLFTLALLLAASVSIARQLGLSHWAQVALIAAMTLRHRVGLTGVNTLESYMQPRMLAFGIGLAAVSTYLHARLWLAIGLVAIAAIVHPTTAVWFAVWIGVAIWVSAPRSRRPLAASAAVAATGLAWAIGWGPLAERNVPMDAGWLGVLAAKNYLFADAWPVSMWLVAGLYVAVVCAVYLRRRSTGQLHPRETGLVAGAVTLALIFAASLPWVAARNALAVQLQISRLFWMLDVFGTVYLVWAVADRSRSRTEPPAEGRRPPGRAAIVAAVMICASVGRGAYVMWIEHPGRPVVEIGLPGTDWQDAMNWLKATPMTAHVLADPGHAWRYGTSVRVAASRDTYLEEVKDAALAMYSRRIAARVAERTAALGSFDALTPERAVELARRYELDYLVTERSLGLPLAYRNARFSIYRLR